MSKVVKVENLSKAYQLGQFSTGTLSADIHRWWSLKRGKEDPYLKIGETNNRSVKGSSDIVWSLKDINFDIEQGSAVGIIGKNGAGKSTLLKVLSQITSPTTGSLKIKGRIASLLEVGTGFHPELTGRENIFLNGAILGMRKKEISSKFDEIVAFAGVERYIDTPVKRYSSGMYVRLAFAVAAHLESEILIVDEVLAVGDADFQKKCIGKMNSISKGQGRTILFVSHNMASINQLCDQAILLENGQVSLKGQTGDVVQKYMFNKINENSIVHLKDSDSNFNNQKVKITKAWITAADKSKRRSFTIGESITFNYELYADPSWGEAEIGLAIVITNSNGIRVCNMVDKYSKFQAPRFSGSIVASSTLHDLRLYPDIYFLSFWVGPFNASETYEYAEDCLSFEIINGGNLSSWNLPTAAFLLYYTPEWEINKIK
jgi:lipopolysaccharide transport system ATP-binding protein